MEFTFDGERYVLEVPADGRLVCSWARDGAWPQLVPWALVPSSRDAFLALLADPDGPVDLSVCRRIAVELAPDIYGVPWWTAGRVAASMSAAWDRYASWAVTRGFDPAREPAHRVTASGLAWMRAGMSEEKESERLEQMLFVPPRPTRKPSPEQARKVPGFTPAEQAAAFKAAMASLGSGTD
ncbi:hypothetical protein ACFU0X_10265 [Streptomyces cellulosae]|uniref:Lsr2 protein n=1 Tax=Streptomyces cellulosae TaxID=1968 RepID=A0ABW6JFD7_STRCE